MNSAVSAPIRPVATIAWAVGSVIWVRLRCSSSMKLGIHAGARAGQYGLGFGRQQQHPATGGVVDHQRDEPLDRVAQVSRLISVVIAAAQTSSYTAATYSSRSVKLS